MNTTVTIDLASLARDVGLSEQRVTKVVELLDAGNTVPFITRYRKDQTGGLDEEQIRQIQDRLGQLRQLAERKQTILRSIEAQGKLTPQLEAALLAANTSKRLEDLYLPFKPKKQTLATLARERGLEALAREIRETPGEIPNLDERAKDFANPDRNVPTPADALLGAGHILAEQYSEHADFRQRLREIIQRTGELVSTHIEPAEGAKPDDLHQRFQDYYNYREKLSRVPPHRVLAINRGERAKVLRVKIECDSAALERVVDELLVPADHPHVEFLRGCGRDALQRLVMPSLEREIRRELTDESESHAVEVFARNLRNLLLQAPVHGRRILAIDPGYKSGCKLAAIDEFGNLLGHGIVHIIGKPEKKQEAREKILQMVREHNLSVVAIGNGSACRQVEELINELVTGELQEAGTAYVIVNEAGASVYSASRLGREEFPDYDATLRGTISIGRRLQDPLSELVKIDPSSIGVGLYQHDVKASHLRDSLDAVIESCVNYVGVDVNTASPALLRYVSGLNQLTARRLYDFRVEHGPFRNREQLKEVPGLGESAFTQSAGFLKIAGGDQPLDATWIHPESYEVTRRVLDKTGGSIEQLGSKEAAEELTRRANEALAGVAALANELSVGELTLRDILTQLARPGRDPREDLPPPVFKRGILKLEDLSVGMELSGTVLNVVDFGAFVDIGLNDSGLVHISQLANRYIGSPHEVVAVGDIVRVWVLGVDKARRRVSLTMISPQEKERAAARAAPPQRRGKPPVRSTEATGAPADVANGQPAQSAGRAQQGAPRPHTHQRSNRPPRHARQGQQRREGSQSQPPRRSGRSRPPIVAKLTKEMEEGKEPLRTFGELKKLWELRQQDEPPKST